MIIFEKVYDGESICDIDRDVSEAFDQRYNPVLKDIPDGPYFPNGTFTILITWSPDE
jgi:hypothetical protein